MKGKARTAQMIAVIILLVKWVGAPVKIGAIEERDETKDESDVRNDTTEKAPLLSLSHRVTSESHSSLNLHRSSHENQSSPSALFVSVTLGNETIPDSHSRDESHI